MIKQLNKKVGLVINNPTCFVEHKAILFSAVHTIPLLLLKFDRKLRLSFVISLPDAKRFLSAVHLICL